MKKHISDKNQYISKVTKMIFHVKNTFRILSLKNNPENFSCEF